MPDMNVGDVLTWGPCYYFQKQFFEAKVNNLSTAEHLMRATESSDSAPITGAPCATRWSVTATRRPSLAMRT